jgi:hypothetical protein
MSVRYRCGYDRKIGYKREFLREISNEVRVKGNAVLTNLQGADDSENSTIRRHKPSDGGVLYTVSFGGADGGRTHGL